MWWGSGREKIEPGRPSGVHSGGGIAVDITTMAVIGRQKT